MPSDNSPGKSPESLMDDYLYNQFLNEVLTLSPSKMLPDNDDASEDPDFVECSIDDNLDVDEDDGKIQVTKSEAVALVKEAFELYDDDSTSIIVKTKSFGNTSKNANELIELTEFCSKNNESNKFSRPTFYNYANQQHKHQQQQQQKKIRFNNEIEKSLFNPYICPSSTSSATSASETNETELFDYSRLNTSAHHANNLDCLSTSYILSASTVNILDQTLNTNYQSQQQINYLPSNTQILNTSTQSSQLIESTTNSANQSTGLIVIPETQSSRNERSQKEPDANESIQNASKCSDSDSTLVFNDSQRKQLDEQLRNHVQLLTQTCLATFMVNESTFKRSWNLLRIWDKLSSEGLTSKDLNENENNCDHDKSTNESNNTSLSSSDEKIRLSSSFSIVNLNDSLKIIDEIASMNKEQVFGGSYDQSNGFPLKFIEIIVNSPVFYNINLIPKCRYKYRSQFKRSQFLDSEKILLIMGYNKFKHLSKDECCQCIKDHLLPNRTKDEIKKQLSSISNSEQRQLNLKELLNKQNMERKSISFNKNLDFIKELHYKSPIEQSDNVELPSMYTMTIERFKMSSILKETHKLKDLGEKANKLKKSAQLQVSCNESMRDDLNLNESSFENASESSPKSSSSPKTNKRIRPADDCIDLIENDCVTSKKSTFLMNSTMNENMNSTAIEIVNANETTNTNNRNQNLTRHTSQVRSNKIRINSIRNMSNENLGQSILIANNLNQTSILQQQVSSNQLISKQSSSPLNLLHPAQTNGPILTINPNNFTQHQPSILVPPNFMGTIVYQPIIHVHHPISNLNDLTKKFRQIVPKSIQNEVHQKK